MDYIRICLVLLFVLMITPLQGIRFNQDTFGVWFNLAPTAHKAFESDNEYDSLELQILVEKVSTRFKTLMISPPGLYGNESRGMENANLAIPEVVANYNKFHHHLKDGDGRPLELIVHFLPTPSRAAMGSGNTSFDTALELADKANSVFPATVKTLLLLTYTFDDDGPLKLSRDSFQVNMSEYQSRIEKVSQFEYQLGVSLPREFCSPSGSPLEAEAVSIMVSGSIQILFFEYPAEERHLEMGVEAAFPEIEAYFQSCKERIARINSMLQVGFLPRWPDTTKAGAQNASALVDFWLRMNEWSVRASTKLVMSYAFDFRFETDLVPDDFWSTHNSVTAGWWKVNESASSDLSHVSGFVIEEKVGDLILQGLFVDDEDDGELPIDTPPGISGVVTTSLIALSILLFLLATAALVILLWRKWQLQQQQQQHLPSQQSMHFIRETNELLSDFNQLETQ